MMADMPAERMWTVSEERDTVRMQLPSLSIVGIPEPLRSRLDLDAEMVEGILQRLAVPRSQMLPAPLND